MSAKGAQPGLSGVLLVAAAYSMGIDIDEAIRRLKLTPSPVWPSTAPCPCGCVKDVATQSEDCGCCFVTNCEGDGRYPLILCRLHDGHEVDPPESRAPFYRNKHRCWQCATKGSPSEGWECPGCGQREWCEDNCRECKGRSQNASCTK